MPKEKPLPTRLHREKSRIYYGNIHIATLHDQLTILDVIRNPDALRKFGERNRKRVWEHRYDCGCEDCEETNKDWNRGHPRPCGKEK